MCCKSIVTLTVTNRAIATLVHWRSLQLTAMKKKTKKTKRWAQAGFRLYPTLLAKRRRGNFRSWGRRAFANSPLYKKPHIWVYIHTHTQTLQCNICNVVSTSVIQHSPCTKKSTKSSCFAHLNFFSYFFRCLWSGVWCVAALLTFVCRRNLETSQKMHAPFVDSMRCAHYIANIYICAYVCALPLLVYYVLCALWPCENSAQ